MAKPSCSNQPLSEQAALFRNARAAANYCWNAIYGSQESGGRREWIDGFIEGWESFTEAGL